MESEKKYFNYNELYPNSLSILNGQQIDLKEFYKTVIFVLDTNSLLVPYNIGKETLEDIEKIYQVLISKDRLFIPAHVLKEFAKNRSTKIGDLYTVIDSELSNLLSIKSINYPILNEMSAYKKLIDSKKKIEDNVKEYKEALKELQIGISNWNWFDSVTQLYYKTFKAEIIIEIKESEEILIKEFNKRCDSNIPPGYKDKSKDENSIGDFLIWKVILELGKSKKSNVVFVTNDEKSDWLLKGNKKSISTRFELVDEFFRITDGMRFSCVNFADFLKHQGAQDETILEVENSIDIKKVSKNGSTIEILGEISDIVKSYLIDCDEDYPEGYISNDDLKILINNYSTVWREEFGNKLFGRTLSYIDNLLEKMETLNFDIHYNAVRMKRSTRPEEVELKNICKKYLEEVNELMFLMDIL